MGKDKKKMLILPLFLREKSKDSLACKEQVLRKVFAF